MKSTHTSLDQKVRRIFSKIGSMILMFQKVPLHHVIAYEARFVGSSGITQLVKWSIATVSGLGVYDTVSGATQITQVAPSPGSSNVPATTGEMLSLVYQMTGADGNNSRPKSWKVSGNIPAGLTHANSTDSYTDFISGVPTESGTFQVTVRGYEDPGYRGGSKSKTFTINIVQGIVAPTITTQPQSARVDAGASVTLSVVATGAPLTYQWYLGGTGDLTNSINGANSASYTTPALSATTSCWVQVTNSGGTANSAAATVEVNDTFASWSGSRFTAQQLGNPAISGAGADPDGDRTTNEDEFIWGTDPLVADRFLMPSIAASAGQILLSFTADAAAGSGYSGLTRHYTLEVCSDLSGGVWTPVPGYADIVATGQLVESNSVIALGSKYYRLRAWLSAN